MIKFTFTSGKTYEVQYAWDKLAPKLQLSGLRMFNPEKGVLIPLNSNTIALIEQFDDYESDEDKVQIIAEEEKLEEDTDAVADDVFEELEKEEKELSIEEKKEQMLAEMKLKSSCNHPEYQLYRQEITAGPRNNRHTQQRFFNVCKICGVRERYLKNDTVSDEDKANALLWDK